MYDRYTVHNADFMIQYGTKETTGRNETDGGVAKCGTDDDEQRARGR
jgi:hypothetical protein